MALHISKTVRAKLLFAAVVLFGACVYKAPHDPTDPDDPADPSDPSDPMDPTDPTDPVVDTDLDGVPDATDNCPSVANANQADEDADLVGNACDNCPHIANPGQEDVMETNNGETADLVGDACDPDPTHGGNSIRLFMGFDDPAEITDWSFAGNDSHAVTGGSLVIDGSDLAILFKNNLNADDSFITTSVHYVAVDTMKFRGATVMTRFNRNGDFGTGVGCGEMRDTAVNNSSPFRDIVLFGGGGFGHNVVNGPADVTANHDAVYTAHGRAGTNQIDCNTGGQTYSATTSNFSGTGINFAVWGATVEFRYLVVID